MMKFPANHHRGAAESACHRLLEAQELRQRTASAHALRRRRAGAARDAAATYKHATDEDLGYIHTDDSFGKILADARHELSERFSEARLALSRRWRQQQAESSSLSLPVRSRAY